MSIASTVGQALNLGFEFEVSSFEFKRPAALRSKLAKLCTQSPNPELETANSKLDSK